MPDWSPRTSPERHAAKPVGSLRDPCAWTECLARPDFDGDGIGDALYRLEWQHSGISSTSKCPAPDPLEGGLPFSCDAAFLSRVALLNLETEAGDLDVCFVPNGTRGYDDLIVHVARFDLDGVVAPTAALLDIIRSKSAANRPKDQESLPTLEELARKLGLLA